MKILGIFHDFKIFFISKGSFNQDPEEAGVSKFFYNRRYFLNFRRYLKKLGRGLGPV
jgi:hypothetical protein